MSVLLSATAKDTAHLITAGIKNEIACAIHDELLEYLIPMVQQIAKKQAEKVCQDALLNIERDVVRDQINVLVQFKSAT